MPSIPPFFCQGCYSSRECYLSVLTFYRLSHRQLLDWVVSAATDKSILDHCMTDNQPLTSAWPMLFSAVPISYIMVLVYVWFIPISFDDLPFLISPFFDDNILPLLIGFVFFQSRLVLSYLPPFREFEHIMYQPAASVKVHIIVLVLALQPPLKPGAVVLTLRAFQTSYNFTIFG